jgi:hemerythrin-like domain-containing protein
MARTKNSRASLPVALELLESEHRAVEALFDRYEDEKEEGGRSRRALALRICAMLTEHTRLEEEILYPWLRENLGSDSSDLVDEALVEHASAKDLIAQIEGARDVDETFDARVKVLGEYVRHHVREEEDEIFPLVARKVEALDELGQEMHARKAELMEELGLDEEEEAPPGMPMQGRRGGSHAQRSSR